MSLNEEKPIVISVGGSLLVPGEINTSWLVNFRAWLIDQIKLDRKFILVCGGGQIARKYQKATKEILSIDSLENFSLDLLGIASTALNAELIKALLPRETDPEILRGKPSEIKPLDYPITLSAGWEPGASTDKIAVELTRIYSAEKLINLTDIDYVYDQDPKNNPEAKALPNLTWAEFLALLPKKWSPGLKSPFDPIASHLASELGIELAIIGGQDLRQLDYYLANQDFIGTLIRS